MAGVDAQKLVDALGAKLARSIIDATINELALAQAEEKLAELGELGEPSDPERDD